MDRYSAVTECRLDCRTDRPSWDDSVFCRDIGTKEDEDEVDALEILDGGGIMVTTDIAPQELDGVLAQKRQYRDTVSSCALWLNTFLMLSDLAP